jgi:hypothetical protein
MIYATQPGLTLVVIASWNLTIADLLLSGQVSGAIDLSVATVRTSRVSKLKHIGLATLA